jgi:DNA-binding NtrC family response regulator
MTGQIPRILVVDDEPAICRSCVKILSRDGWIVSTAANGIEALDQMAAAPVALVITDLKMQRLGGMELLSRIRETFPGTPVVVMTGYASVASAVEVMKLGAGDYLPKPFTPDELRAVVRQVLTAPSPEPESVFPDAGISRGPILSHRLVGHSPKIRQVAAMVQKVAPTDATVLICGESGTGKELIARAIHANSNRRDAVFFAVDCGTLSEGLLASELFGHVRGAFTGAHQDRDGIFGKADGGTVFLDEISNISIEVQGKLLRFLENREFLPVGGNTVQRVDIRLVLATNRDLKQMVAAGTFREDFYYRIFVYPLPVPPLRERREDIPAIARHFLDQYRRAMGRPAMDFDALALGLLLDHDWPGNVRELRNLVERAVIQSETDRIMPRDLGFTQNPGTTVADAATVPTNRDELRLAKQNVRQAAADGLERQFVIAALDRTGGNVSKAARQTGLQRSNLQALIKKHRIRVSR